MRAFSLCLLLSLFVFVSVFTSCRSIRQEIKSQEDKTELITEKTIAYQDTILYTSASQSILKIPTSVVLEKDFKRNLKDIEKPFKPRIYSQKNGNATAKIRIEKDTILVFAHCDSIALKAKIKKEFESKYQSQNKVKVEEKKEKKTSVLELILCTIGGIGLGFMAGFIAGKIIKI